MSNTTPESPNPKPEDDSAVVEPADTDADIANPPSGPVSARGHVNAPEAAAANAAAAEATPEAVAEATPAETPSVPAAVTAPEPLVSSDEDVAAAVARSAAETGAEETGAETVAVDETSGTEAYAAPQAVEPTTAPEPGTIPAAAAAGAAAAGAGAAVPPGAYGQPVTPIYITAPLPPKKKSNRGFGILIALIGTVAFAVVYAAIVAIIGAINTPADRFVDEYTNYLLTASFYVPVIFFFAAMVVLIQIVNRAGWWAYVIGGFFVAAIVYASFIGGALLQNAHNLTPAEVSRFVGQLWLNPFAIWAGVVAREVSIWTGLWLAIRGRKLKVKNAEAQAEYERTLAAGPGALQNGYAPGA